jgi:hypothetical protein
VHLAQIQERKFVQINHLTFSRNYVIIIIEREGDSMTKAQALEMMILNQEEYYGKSILTLQLRYLLSRFKGYEHYEPTNEEFDEYFEKTIDK